MLGDGCFSSIEAEFSAWVAIGFLLCFISSEIFAPWIFPQLVPAYTRLPRHLMLEWNSRWNSTLHASFICISCFGLLAFCPNLWHDRLFSSNYPSELVMCISTGYMLYDAATMPMYTSGTELVMFYVHHGVTVLGSTVIVTRNFGKFYAILTKLLIDIFDSIYQPQVVPSTVRCLFKTTVRFFEHTVFWCPIYFRTLVRFHSILDHVFSKRSRIT
ncbi:hypothetical protein FGIG_06882 [Fasciola gigantica]|uniref:Uncharacterized protein n=1 Tax=Fasciola gigantica TaxID=46835 RepID=A0A504Z495_FASGI|nr:hypothetical protein FGIG_06882 [Fasciola gigantica]